MILLRYPVQGIQDPETPLVQVESFSLAPDTLRQVLFRPVFAREKPACQGIVGYDAQPPLPAQGFQLSFVIDAVIEIIFRLRALIQGQSQPLGDLQRQGKPFRAEVRSALWPSLFPV